ncbi:MAG: NAD(P)-dependent oxidoreductase [Candidatus Acidiferrales bacterium]
MSPATKPNIGFIGLGLLGTGVAGRLLSQGFSVTVWNRTPEKAEPLVRAGAKRASSPQQAAARADVVVTMVLDGPAVESLALGPAGIAASLGRGKIHCDMSTIDVATSRRLGEHYRTLGSDFVSAPVLGNRFAAAAGKLLIFAGGRSEAIDVCAPMFEALGEKLWRFDRPEIAASGKLCCNLLLAGMIEIFSESLLLAERSGIAPKTFLDIVGSSNLGALLYQVKGDLIIRKDYQKTFYARNLLKDLNLALDAGAEANVNLPGARGMRDVYAAACDQGFAEKDYVEIFEWLAKKSAGA